MKSIVEEALMRENGQINSNYASHERLSDEDRELDKLLAELSTNICVVGCGGGGSNTVQRMYIEDIDGAEICAINTDAQHLRDVRTDRKLLIGRKKTRGLGAGSLPKIGEDAANENEDDIRAMVNGADMVFVTCGLGGGTGTGAAPVVASIAKEMGALTIAVVTMPFSVEGNVRSGNAEAGLERLRDVADTVIVVPNDRLLEVVPRLPLQAAFKVSDEVLMRAVKGITELITKPGMINLDFADVRTIMQNGGVAMIGLGEADGENKASESVQKALRSPLLDVDISGATAALVNVVGGADMTIAEAEGVVDEVYRRIDPDARLIWGAQIDPTLEHTVRTMLVVTGVKSSQILGRVNNQARVSTRYGIDFVR